MIAALANATAIHQAQVEQDLHGHQHPDKRKFYVLTDYGLTARIALWVLLPKALYRQIEWTQEGAVFFAHK